MYLMKMLFQRGTGNTQNISELFQRHMTSKIMEQIFLRTAAECLRLHTNTRFQASSPPFFCCSAR